MKTTSSNLLRRHTRYFARRQGIAHRLPLKVSAPQMTAPRAKGDNFREAARAAPHGQMLLPPQLLLLFLLGTSLLLLLAPTACHAASGPAGRAGPRPHPYVYPGEEVPEDTIRVTTLGSGSPDVRRGQVRAPAGSGGGVTTIMTHLNPCTSSSTIFLDHSLYVLFHSSTTAAASMCT